ncbi:MAG: phosphoglycerate mutase family protein [Micavibrio sp.]|nr:MAG: phosphoglycerate mutase family protein [Micavibrio sp.]
MTDQKKGRLIIIRHGQTEYNRLQKMTGQKNVPLAEKGEEQARDTGKFLGQTHLDHVFASPLDRAFKTAELILDNMDEKATAHLKNTDGTWNIAEDFDLMEQDTGDFTGRNYKTDPDIIAFDRRYADNFPGGESAADVVARLTEFYERDIKPLLEDGKTVMVVCHSNVVRSFKVLLGEATPESFHKHRAKVRNAAPWMVEFDSATMKAVASYMMDEVASDNVANDNNNNNRENRNNPDNAAQPDIKKQNPRR